MKRSDIAGPDRPAPWYRHRWPWLLIAGPALTIVGCIVTIVLAFQHADPVVARPDGHAAMNRPGGVAAKPGQR